MTLFLPFHSSNSPLTPGSSPISSMLHYLLPVSWHLLPRLSLFIHMSACTVFNNLQQIQTTHSTEQYQPRLLCTKHCSSYEYISEQNSKDFSPSQSLHSSNRRLLQSAGLWVCHSFCHLGIKAVPVTHMRVDLCKRHRKGIMNNL